MSDDPSFDFWYAVHNTEVIRLPPRKLETFGSTILNYHLLTELMDQPDKIRVREGRIEAYRPQIVTPLAHMQSIVEGFGEAASAYTEWLRKNEASLRILRYGFMIRKQESNEYILTDAMQAVADRVRGEMDSRSDPFGALAIGVDHPWEVCLIKLMVDVVESSVSSNVADLQGKNLFEKARKDPTGIHSRIEILFREAARDRSRLNELHSLLEKANLLGEYEDRFYALVRRHG